MGIKNFLGFWFRYSNREREEELIGVFGLVFWVFVDGRESPYGSNGDGIWVRMNPDGVFWEDDEHHDDVH